jgi:predicted AAA+ superfamily ATPase
MADVAEGQLPTGEGLTFEKVWAMFQEIAERQKETDRQFKETDKKFQETDRQFKETGKDFQELKWLVKETDKQIKQNNEQYGDLGRRFGEVVEHLVAPGIVKKFNEMGYHFSEVFDGNNKIFDKNGQKKAEIDILMENGETVLAVEVKSKPNNKDIQEHIKRLKILRESRREKRDVRKIIGAIAGAVFKDNVKEAAQEAGLYVIVQSGDTMKIDMPEGWEPVAY